MVLKVFCIAALLLLEVSLIKGQWYGGYDCGQYSQQYIVVNPYGPGYDDIYSQFNTYPYNDPQYYSGYCTTSPQYAAQPIVIVVNNDRSDCDIDAILSSIFPIEDKRRDTYVSYPTHNMDARDSCECVCKCECTCRCDGQKSDYCPHCDSPRNRCKCKDDCQCRKDPKPKCNKCQKHDSGCGCGGNIYHKMY